MCLLTEYCLDEFWYTKPMTVTRICSIAIVNKWLKTRRQAFVFRPKQGNKIEGVLLNRAWILGIFCPKQGQGFKASAAHLYPNICLVLPPPPPTAISKKKKTSALMTPCLIPGQLQKITIKLSYFHFIILCLLLEWHTRICTSCSLYQALG